MIALSLADSRTVKQTKLSSRGLLTVRISVKSRTQCGSVRGSENLSTENHVELKHEIKKKLNFRKNLNTPVRIHTRLDQFAVEINDLDFRYHQ